MITYIEHKRPSVVYRLLSCFIAMSFIFTSVIPPATVSAQVTPQTILNLPVPGTMMNVTSGYQPAMIAGMITHPDNPLEFDFIIDSGQTGLDGEAFNEESRKMIKYFLASLTTPEEEMWVNLSPYEGNRIIPTGLGVTEMGRDLLAQDYILKQLTASLMYPEEELGGEFWARVQKKAMALYGTTDIPMNTFNKIWIVPSKATVYQKGSSAFVLENHLKVMLEEDYVALKENLNSKTYGTDQVDAEEAEVISGVTSDVVKEVLIPEIEYEVNNGEHFAQLRQISNAMVLATWYKENLKESLLGYVYVDQNKTRGIDVNDRDVKQKIYDQYLEAFEKGVYNYIKEDYDPTTDQVIPRKYFSGGFVSAYRKVTTFVNGDLGGVSRRTLDLVRAKVTNQASRLRMVTTGLVDVGKQALQTAVNQVEVQVAQGVQSLGMTPNNFSLQPIRSGTDFAMFSQEGEKTASTITPIDAEKLRLARDQGNIGFHKNVDPTPVVPALASAVTNWKSISSSSDIDRLKADEAQMYRDNKIIPIVMIGGEATRFGGPKTFVNVSDDLGEFLEIKAANLNWLRQTFGSIVPLFLLSSEKRLAEFKSQLKDRNYYGLSRQDFQFYVQDTVDTFIPTDQEIESNYSPDEVDRYKAFARTLREQNPDGIYRFQGERRKVPGGHFDAIASFVISGRFSEALEIGGEYGVVFNIDNLQAILKNDGQLAHFAESGKDFGFALAEKNLTYTVNHSDTDRTDKVIVRFGENVISFDGIQEFTGSAEIKGVRYVINADTRSLDVFDVNTDQPIQHTKSAKPETGGTLVELLDESGQRSGNVTMREGFELKPDFDHANAPFFNTNTVQFRLQSLLNILGVTQEQLEEMNFEQRSELVREKLVTPIKPNFEFKKHVVQGEFAELGNVKNGTTEIPVSQVTRIMLQVAHIPEAKVEYYSMPRKEVFAPVKEPEDKPVAAANNRESLRNFTTYASRDKGIDNAMLVDGDFNRWRQTTAQPAQLNVDMFRDYDYRNTGPKLTPEVVFRMGLVWANQAIEKAEAAGIDDRTVLVARDARKIEPELIDALIAALRFRGMDVKYMAADEPNAVTSYSWGVQQFKPLMSIFMTASHVSKPEDVIVRGFKVAMLKEKGGNIQSLTTREIKGASLDATRELLENPELIDQFEAPIKGTLETVDITANVIAMNAVVGRVAAQNGSIYELGQRLKRSDNPEATLQELVAENADIQAPLRGMKVVIEGYNTPSGKLAAGTYRALGAEVLAINDEVREISGEHNADPSIESNLAELKQAIIDFDADFGIGFDLDGDRGAIVVPERSRDSADIKWHNVAPDNIIVTLLPSLIQKWGYNRQDVNVGVIRDVLGTNGVNDVAERTGTELFQTDAGYVFLKAVKEAQEKNNFVFPIYGERSGHTWLDVTGEIENPVAVSVLFATLVHQTKRDLFNQRAAGQVAASETVNPVLDVYNENTIPYLQSPRFQPLFHPNLLATLAADARNTSGFVFDAQKPEQAPPQQIIALGKDYGIRQLQSEFTPGKTYATPSGDITVRAFNSFQDVPEDGGLYRFADIVFEQDGNLLGRFVFRASSNDPTFVTSYESPEYAGETSQVVASKKQAVGGVVLDFLSKSKLALVTKADIDTELFTLTAEDRQARFQKANLAQVEPDLRGFRGDAAMLSFEQASEVYRRVSDIGENRSRFRQLVESQGPAKVNELVVSEFSKLAEIGTKLPTRLTSYADAYRALDTANRTYVDNTARTLSTDRQTVLSMAEQVSALTARYNQVIRPVTMNANQVARERQQADVVAQKLHTVLSPQAQSVAYFQKGGFGQAGYGVAARAVNDGSHAIGAEGNQGYFVDRTEIVKADGTPKSGREVFVDTTTRMRDFFQRRAQRNGKPIRLVIKPGIGGQHTPFQGIADVFQVFSPETGEMLGEYELGKDYEAAIGAALRQLGADWDQVAVIPSSKSGSTDETMMIFVDVFQAVMKNVADSRGIDGQVFADTTIKYLNSVIMVNGVEVKGPDLFRDFNFDELVTQISAQDSRVNQDVARNVLGTVLGNMFFETTDRPEASRLSAFIRNSGLDRVLGEDAPGFGAMFDNVGGRWTGDLHMMAFLAFHDLDANAYWQARYEGIQAVRGGRHQGVELANKIVNEQIRKIALVVPDEFFWAAKGNEQNFNESIWQSGFANLRAVKASKWQAQQQYYQAADAMVINLSDLNLGAGFNEFKLGRVDQGSDLQGLANEFGRLFTTFYGMTHTVGNRLIARALQREGLRAEDIDVNDLDNPATKILQENLYLRQPFVELGKGLLETRLKEVQTLQQAWVTAGSTGVSPIRQAEIAVSRQAADRRVTSNVVGLENVQISSVQQFADTITAARSEAVQSGRTFVPFLYLGGNEYVDLRESLVDMGVEWVMQGTGDQHISYQQVLANPDRYLPFFVSFVPAETDFQKGTAAIGFAKSYLDQVSPNLVRDYFAQASYEALTTKDVGAKGGLGVFVRTTESPARIQEVKQAFEQSFTQSIQAATDSAMLAIDADNVEAVVNDIDQEIQALGLEVPTVEQVREALRETDENQAARSQYGFSTEFSYRIDPNKFITVLSEKLGVSRDQLLAVLSQSENSEVRQLVARAGATAQIAGVAEVQDVFQAPVISDIDPATELPVVSSDQATDNYDYVPDLQRRVGELTTADRAQAGDKFTKGGIDLNPQLLDLQIKRDDSGIPLPIQQQPIGDMNIDGFLPVIINVAPVTNLPLLLGLADSEVPDELSFNLSPADLKARFEMNDVVS